MRITGAQSHPDSSISSGFMVWKKASYREFKEFIGTGDVMVLLPTGSIEQHGPHLPLETDCFIAEGIAIEAGKEIGSKTRVKALVAPPICPGLSMHWKPFPGTLTFTSGTFASILTDVLGQIVSEISSYVLVVNGHGGNSGLIQTLLDELHLSYPEAVLAHTDWWKMLGEEGIRIFQEKVFAHAEEVETSVYLALGGVLRSTPPTEEPQEWPFTLQPAPGAQATVYRSVDLGNGVFGEPRLATREKGERALSIIKRNYAKLASMMVEESKGFTNPI